MLLDILERNMQSDDAITVDGLWNPSVIIVTLPDGPVSRCQQASRNSSNRLSKSVKFEEEDEGLGLPEKHGHQLRLGVIALLVGISYC